MQGLRWEIAEPLENRHVMASACGVPPLVGQMLLNRGIFNPAKARDFLSPSMSQLHDPYLIPGMEKAADRIACAIRQGETVAIFGDYDTDGLTATATMYHALKFFGARVLTYVPHRQNEGYGLNTEALVALAADATLIITVDCGITAVEQAQKAAELGVDLIITDHHQAKDTLPVCYALVHPALAGSTYPNKQLCGAGVAFKLAWAIGKKMSSHASRCEPEYAAHLQELLAFTALGTIADVVSLTEENRVIVVHGLQKLATTNFIGLRAFIRSAGYGSDGV